MNTFYTEEVIVRNQDWRAPKAVNQEFEVLVWGGGGAGACASFDNPISGGGGGSGYMNFGTFKIPEDESVQIEIGEGGSGIDSTNALPFKNAFVGASGGMTRFGNYIFASGGQGGNGNMGGEGGYRGGNAGEPGAGNYGSFGIVGDKDGIQFMSGGGGSGINARGRGGSANMTLGDAGTSGGGAGAFAYKVTSNGTIYRRTGNGGRGVCLIRYNRISE